MPTRQQLHRQWEIYFEFPDLRREGDPLKATFAQAENRRKDLWPDKYLAKDKQPEETSLPTKNPLNS